MVETTAPPPVIDYEPPRTARQVSMGGGACANAANWWSHGIQAATNVELQVAPLNVCPLFHSGHNGVGVGRRCHKCVHNCRYGR